MNAPMDAAYGRMDGRMDAAGGRGRMDAAGGRMHR